MAALTGQLLADFSDFTRAVEGAVVSLQKFDSGADQVKTSLDAMVDTFSGRKVIQDATLMAEAVERIGGVSKLTKDELERVGAKASEAADKLRAMGKDVPAGIQQVADATKNVNTAGEGWVSWLGQANNLLGAFGIGISAAAVVNFGKAILDDASALTKLHDQTGISVEGLQALRIAGDDSGVSLTTMTTAVTKLQQALGSGDTSAAAALQDLGINVGKFKQLEGAEQLAAISEAVRGMHDPLRVATDLSALFGKGWAETLPALKRGFEEVKDGTGQMSAFAVKMFNDMDSAMQKTSRSWKASVGELVATVLDNSLTGGLLALNAQLAAMQAKAEKAAPALGGLVPPGLPKDLDDIVTKSDAWAKEIAAVQGAMIELDSVGKGWQGTLETVNGDVVEAIKWYLEAGVSQGALATAFGLTAAQVKAVDSAMKDALATQKVWTDFEKESHKLFLDHWKEEEDAKKKQTAAVNKDVVDGNAQIMAAEAELRDLKMKDSLDATSYQILKIWEKADAEIAAFKGTKDQAERHKAAVTQLAEEQVNAIQYAAETSIDHVAKHGLEVVGAAASQLQSLVGGIKMPGMGIESAGGLKYLTLPNGTRVEIGPHGELPDNIDDLIMGRTGISSGYGNQPRIGTGYEARAEGGSVSSGTPYLVGERGPELFVPSASGAIVPNGGGGGVTQNVVIHVNGTAADVARQVANELMRTLRAGQQLTLR